MHKIGNTIRKLRLESGLTQKQLAVLMKVSSAKICTVEKSSLPITAKTLLKFAAALKVSPAQLMYEEWNSFAPYTTAILRKELNEKINQLDQQLHALRQILIDLYDELHSKQESIS